MPTVRYTVIDGEVIAEKRSGVRKEYVPDPLGSTVALLDSTQTVTDSFSYWPYGEEQNRTGSTQTPFEFVGTMGYYRDSASKTYVRARYLEAKAGRWLTEDPIGFDGDELNLYVYCYQNPVNNYDRLGLEGSTSSSPVDQAFKCVKCAREILDKWYWNPLHYCNHPYAHCMACCALTRVVGSGCAQAMQHGQNFIRFFQRGSEGSVPWRRNRICSVGIRLGELPFGSCHALCNAVYPNWDTPHNPSNPKCNPDLPYTKKFPPLSSCCGGNV